jgi:hypothetical protein
VSEVCERETDENVDAKVKDDGKRRWKRNRKGKCLFNKGDGVAP